MVSTSLFTYAIVNWPTAPTGYDTVNIYRSTNETQGFTLIASLPSTQTQYIDTSVPIAAKDAYFYVVSFSNASTPDVQTTPQLAWKLLTPREQKFVYQLRDITSRFVSNRLADEELRQYMQHGLQTVNVYSPETAFTMVDLPLNLEPLVLTAASMYGIMFNMLAIGMTDVNINDNGISMQFDRFGKMSGTLKEITTRYNEMLGLAKMEYADGGVAIGTSQLPIGIGGRVGSILGLIDAFQNLGR